MAMQKCLKKVGFISLSLLISCSGNYNKKILYGKDSNSVNDKYHIFSLTESGKDAYLKGELIYPLDNKPTPQSHASTIVETPGGMVTAFFAGTHEKHPDVGIWISRLVDDKWTWPKEVVNGVESDTLRYPCWNPVLFLPDGGDLMLFYKVGPSPQTWWGMVMTSKDYGVTWSEPRMLGEHPTIGHLLGPVKNKPIQLEDGTIISPTSIEYPKERDEDQDWRVYFEISKDLGKSWNVIGPINDGVKFDAIQPSILTYPDGSMQVICRTRQNVLAESWSTDQGKTWSVMTGMNLPNPNSGTDAVTLRDGRQLLVYNHSTKAGEEPKGRNILNLAISNNGKDWTPVMTLENEPIADGYAYPAIIQSTDGLVHITYTFNRRSIKYVIVDPDKL